MDKRTCVTRPAHILIPGASVRRFVNMTALLCAEVVEQATRPGN